MELMKDDLAIKVDNISKCYRIGLKEQVHDSITSAMMDFIRSPIRNYRNHRSLYRFDNINPGNTEGSSDIFWALNDVSFKVKRGEVIGIIGRNGAGKSTILKILSKITDPTCGRAEIQGRVSSLLEVGTGFHPDLTGRENVYLNATILGMKKKEVDRKFNDIVDFSGVEKFIDTPVKRYSSGMKVRLAFSVAAHLEPEILIVDEVLSVGDAEFQKKCLNRMENVGHEGRTVLFVSHNMPSVARLCSRVILLEGGMVKADGSPSNVIGSYLQSDAGTTAARKWPHPETAPGGDVARLRAVRVCSKDGSIAETVDIREPIKVEMEYDVLKDGYSLLPHFRFVDEDDIAVFTTLDNDPSWQGSRPKGHYVSTTWIPGNFLSEGTLFVSCHLVTLHPTKIQFSERQVIAFNVIDTMDGSTARGNWSGPMDGLVRPLLQWHTQYNPNGNKSSSIVNE
jgi:lipopolysaccharide transport system ATP-binding protein